MLSRMWVPRRVSFGPHADSAGFPRPSVFFSSLCSCPLPLSTVSGLSVTPGDISSLPGAFRAKGTIHGTRLSTSQGGGRKRSRDQCFCNLYNRATNPCNSTASLPALKSGRRWHGWSHRSHWSLACSSFLPTLFSPCPPQHNVLAPMTLHRERSGWPVSSLARKPRERRQEPSAILLSVSVNMPPHPQKIQDICPCVLSSQDLFFSPTSLALSWYPARHPFQGSVASFELCYYGNGRDGTIPLA